MYITNSYLPISNPFGGKALSGARIGASCQGVIAVVD